MAAGNYTLRLRRLNYKIIRAKSNEISTNSVFAKLHHFSALKRIAQIVFPSAFFRRRWLKTNSISDHRFQKTEKSIQHLSTYQLQKLFRFINKNIVFLIINVPDYLLY